MKIALNPLLRLGFDVPGTTGNDKTQIGLNPLLRLGFGVPGTLGERQRGSTLLAGEADPGPGLGLDRRG